MSREESPATDGGTVTDGSQSVERDPRLVEQFETIRQTRRRRAIGGAIIISFLGYLFVQGLAAINIFTEYFNWGFFGESLRNYFPLTEYAVGISFIDFGRYFSFITDRNLLFDPEIGGLLFSWTPDFYAFFIQELGLFSIFGQAGVTLAMGAVGTIMGFPFALLFGVLGSERVTPFPFNFIFRGSMSFIRAIPALVWTLIFIPLAGLGPVSATFAIAVDTVGNLGRLFVDELEEIEDGPIEAMQTTGASKPQIIVFGMLSQVKTSFIAWTLYILEINVRIAVTVGVYGAGGLGQVVEVQQNLLNWSNTMATLMCIFVLIISVELFSQRLRARLRSDEEKMSWRELIVGFPKRMGDSIMK
ncbi:phosphonate ABC transporter, permease protein PhnE [Natrialbaceae archaeon A-CW2]|uniref:phosphonate ABC transporter, permease protein PhnE n=1 Tax=Natronosalvus amylolyticus TaxID=2961994 RepID=UPI0020C94269|nr:phosphonate ABC transporter, permease protein PhnE [Natronosalvus amylolyticus]